VLLELGKRDRTVAVLVDHRKYSVRVREDLLAHAAIGNRIAQLFGIRRLATNLGRHRQRQGTKLHNWWSQLLMQTGHGRQEAHGQAGEGQHGL